MIYRSMVRERLRRPGIQPSTMRLEILQIWPRRLWRNITTGLQEHMRRSTRRLIEQMATNLATADRAEQ
jgi:hypothetical protein